ncbi:MAG: signal recognition particle protein Srp19 [Candidatus Methanomethylicota archaeon]|uniref:Signal recognition particle 19 kDa protein n=1 Tax=Thermoproteota archaeon TaxID=2056631 RepID=A0A497ER71_9CREN|nr:MAG: signal recognition particle protein Srp19 [Candidatus Verstraetearchaeota archaeon]
MLQLSHVLEGLNIPKRDYQVIWTAYFDLKRTRKRGRRVPKGLAIDAPSIEEVKQAIESISGVEILEVDSEKRYPASWWDRSGYIKIKSKLPKSKLLYEIANKLKELRSLKTRRK